MPVKTVKDLFDLDVKARPHDHVQHLEDWKGPIGCSMASWYKDSNGHRVMVKTESGGFCANEHNSQVLLQMLDLVLPPCKTFGDTWVVIEHVDDGTNHKLEYELMELKSYDPVLKANVLKPEHRWVSAYDIVAIAMFDALTLNQDRHGRNALVVSGPTPEDAWRIVPIDHTHTNYETHLIDGDYRPQWPTYGDMVSLLRMLDHEQAIRLHDLVLSQFRRGVRTAQFTDRGIRAEMLRRLDVIEDIRDGTIKRWLSDGKPKRSCSVTGCSLCHS